MKNRTLEQSSQMLTRIILESKTTKQHLHDLINSDLLSDLLNPKANLTLANRAKFRESIGLMTISEFREIADAEVPERFIRQLSKWRKIATEFNYGGPIAWLIPGINLGPLLYEFRHTKFKCFLENETTRRAYSKDRFRKRKLVFWIPRHIPYSKGMNYDKQIDFVKEWKRDHKVSITGPLFGNLSVLAGLILLHYQLTGDNTPLRGLIRTDTIIDDYEASERCCGHCEMNLGLWVESKGIRHSGYDVTWYKNYDCFPFGVAGSLNPGELD